MSRVAYFTIIFLALIGIVLISTKANAQPYYVVSISADESGVYVVDRGSVQRRGNIASAWVAVADKRPSGPGLRPEFYNGVYFIMREAYDCSRSQSSVLYAAAYSRDGSPLGSLDGDDGWKPVIPDTMREEAYKAICSGTYHDDFRADSSVNLHDMMLAFLRD